MVKNKILKKIFLGVLCAGLLVMPGFKSPEGETMSAEELYQYGFERILVNQLGLKEFDEELKEKGYLPVPEEEQTEKQKEQNMGLSCIYLYNDFYFDRLSEEDKKTLEEIQLTEEEEIPAELEKVVLDTYRQVVSRRAFSEDEDLDKLFTYYSEGALGNSKPRMVRIDSVVFGIATMADYDENGNMKDPDKEDEKEEALPGIAEDMEKQMEGSLGETPVCVIVDFPL